MALKSYVITNNCEVPYVGITGMPHRPQRIGFKKFRVNEIVKGELKHANGQPAFILVAGVLPVPINCVKEVVAKDIAGSSNASGSAESGEKKKITLPPMSKAKYIDAAVLGALVGMGVTILAEKQGWIKEVDKKNKYYGGAIGAVASLYLFYRYKTLKAEKPKDKE